MSLEDQVAQLANAIGMHEDVAVREIIRQRDAAQREADSLKSRCERLVKYNDDADTRNWKQERRIAALRGVITRMKRKTGGQN